MRIGQLSRLTGKNISALRYYEQAGLLPAPQRSEGGYRDYPPETVERVLFIVHAQERSFSLREIAAILAFYDRGESPCRGVAKAVEHKIARLENRIALLQERRSVLMETLQSWQAGTLQNAPICSLLNVSEAHKRRSIEMPRKVEVFTAGCPLCEDAVKLVQSLACPNCEVTVYDLREGCETDECRTKAKDYGVQRVPAVVIDGILAACCANNTLDAETLKAAGLGAG